MNDQEKIERIKQIVTAWANDDKAGAVDALVDIIEVLDIDPYLNAPKVKKAAAQK